jgi:SAM-dependent methyltransferase
MPPNPSPPPTFSGQIPIVDEEVLVPIVFRPYAIDLAARLDPAEGICVLELACGTGVLTEQLRQRLPPGSTIIATDLSESMIRHALACRGRLAGTTFQVCDATNLPFEDHSMDAIVSQFGLMFFPDKARALGETRRVLKPGGQLLVNVWGPAEANPIWHHLEAVLTDLFPLEPRPFMPTPFVLSDPAALSQLAAHAGFQDIEISVATTETLPVSPDQLAKGFLHGTPFGVYLRSVSPGFEQTERAVSAGLAARIGKKSRLGMEALVLHARRDQM